MNGKLSEIDKQNLRRLIEDSLARPHWLWTGAPRALRLAIQTVGEELTGSGDPTLSNDTTEVQFPIAPYPLNTHQWHLGEFEKLSNKHFANQADLDSGIKRYVAWFIRIKALRALTLDSDLVVSGDELHRIASSTVSKSLLQMSDLEEHDARDELFRAVPLSGLMTCGAKLTDNAEQLRKSSRIQPHWKTTVMLEAQPVPIGVFAVTDPLVIDRNLNETFFPLRLSIAYPKGLRQSDGRLHVETPRNVWEQLGEQIEKRITHIEAIPGESHTETAAPPDIGQQESESDAQAVKQLRPRWDGIEELFVGPHLIKKFEKTPETQAAVLDSFEKQCWPHSIRNPLPPRGATSPKDRLRGTVRSLNKRHRIPNLLRFYMDGTGMNVIAKVTSK